jgi:hypothetical protein
MSAVEIEAISQQAATVNFGRVILTILAAILFTIDRDRRVPEQPRVAIASRLNVAQWIVDQVCAGLAHRSSSP